MRKLATAALSFSAAVFAANYILPARWLMIPAVVSAVLGAALLAMHRKWARGIALALVFFSLGLLDWFIVYNLTAAKAEALNGTEQQIRGRILEFPEINEDYCRVRIELESDALPSVNAILYDGDKLLTDAKPGQTVYCRGTLSSADTLYGEKYDSYYADGVFFRISSVKGLRLYDRGFDIRTVPVYISHTASQLIGRIFPGDCAVFMRSLMLGDKSGFYDNEALYLAMSRSGLMHTVAVSGMHIAFLISLLIFILGRGRRSALICIAVVWLFILVSGASPSAIRAGFMQTLLLLAPVLRRENDPVTSLSLILAIILAINPFAAASVSLQLSFAAMAGLILFAGRIYKAFSAKLPKALKNKAVRYVLAAVSSSLAIMLTTAPISALHFGYVPLLSALGNIAALWAVSLCFCGGWICCALSIAPLLGKGAAWLCAWLARYIFLAAGLVSSIPYSVLYMQTGGAYVWLISVYIIFAAAFCFRKRRAAALSAAAIISVAALALVFYRADKEYRENDTYSVIDVGQGQCIAAMAGDETLLIDCGNISNRDNAGMLALSYLASRGRDRIDVLILSHLHEDHANGVTMLMEQMPVSMLIVPESTDESVELYREIAASAERHGTELRKLSEGSISCGRIGAKLCSVTDDEDENERCLITLLDIDGFALLSTADASSETERSLMRECDVREADVLIVGHHGSKYSNSERLLEAVGGRTAVISVGYNTYGHPTQEVLERLAESGYNVLRTDEDGTVEIRTERDNG